jgi:hypothetical protein
LRFALHRIACHRDDAKALAFRFFFAYGRRQTKAVSWAYRP